MDSNIARKYMCEVGVCLGGGVRRERVLSRGHLPNGGESALLFFGENGLSLTFWCLRWDSFDDVFCFCLILHSGVSVSKAPRCVLRTFPEMSS